MTEPRLKLGIVGAGYIAQTYAAALGDSPSLQVVGVADRDAAAAAALAARLDCPAHASHRALAEATTLDAAVVCTPPASHGEIARDLVGRGVHVLCEKPFSIAPAEARAMAEAAERAGVLLAMATKFRFVDGVAAARDLLRRGAIGELRRACVAFTAVVGMSGRWHADPRVSGGGVLMDNGPHAVDLMRWLLGPLVAVHAREGERRQGLAVDENVHLHLRGASGENGEVALSWSEDTSGGDYLVLKGTGGEVRVGWRDVRVRRGGGDWESLAPGYDKRRAFERQLRNFAAAIRGREPLRATAGDALASVEVIAAAYAALRRGEWHDVAEAGESTRGAGA